MDRQIFINYSHKNNDFTQRLIKQLEIASFSLWSDLYLEGGETWAQTIERAIQQASLMLVVVSSSAIESEWVQRETLMAQELRIPIIPILIERVRLPLYLIDHQAIDFTKDQPWDQLIATIRRLLGGESEAPASTPASQGVVEEDSEPSISEAPPKRARRKAQPESQQILSKASQANAPARQAARQQTEAPAQPASEDSAQSNAPAQQAAQAESTSTPDAPPRLSIGAWLRAGNDRATGEEDQLDFHHYVNAFADLIESVDTRPPLTIGIFGSWGAGKSFLLNSLKRELKAPNETRSKTRDAKRIVAKVQIVEFNAWEYNATEVIWAGLVRKIMDNLEKEVRLGFWGRLWKRFRHNFGRQWQQGRGRFFGQLLLIFLLTSALVGFVSWVNGGRFDNVGELLVPIVGLSGLVAVVNAVRDALVSPVSQWVTALFEEGNYGRQIEYMADIRSDLEFLEKRLRAANERVLIIIDDLDRCEPNKAVEVLQAINLLLNFDSFVVILGIDARIITGAISKYYSNLLENAGASGYEYLDKIIQIPFRIPLPSEREIRDFIDKQMGSPKPVGQPPARRETSPDAQRSQATRADATARTPQTEPVAQPERNSAVANAAFGYDELRAFQQFSRFLRPNPRHLKRLVNVYLLVRTLANYRGAWAVVDYPVRTARWLIMSAQWSYTSMAMLRCYDELCEQHGRAAVIAAANGSDPLLWLLGKAIPLLDKAKCSHLDDDLDQLRELLRTNEGRMDWDTLDVIRRYTINFNPAVEAEAFEADGLRLETDAAQASVLPFHN